MSWQCKMISKFSSFSHCRLHLNFICEVRLRQPDRLWLIFTGGGEPRDAGAENPIVYATRVSAKHLGEQALSAVGRRSHHDGTAFGDLRSRVDRTLHFNGI